MSDLVSFWMLSNTEFRLTPDWLTDWTCLMTEAPSPVDAVQLEELGLEVEPQAEEETTEE